MATNSRGHVSIRGSVSLDIRVQNVLKQFSRYPALNDVSLDIRSGELIALLGPSGSGKTTLLRLIAGLESPTAGRIFFGNEDASSKTVQQRNVGFVFQAYALFRKRRVGDNPWGIGATTLEWTLSSPPPFHQYETLPLIK